MMRREEAKRNYLGVFSLVLFLLSHAAFKEEMQIRKPAFDHWIVKETPAVVII